jgi:MFS superfamily sulfate permease-like transporter
MTKLKFLFKVIGIVLLLAVGYIPILNKIVLAGFIVFIGWKIFKHYSAKPKMEKEVPRD